MVRLEPVESPVVVVALQVDFVVLVGLLVELVDLLVEFVDLLVEFVVLSSLACAWL